MPAGARFCPGCGHAVASRSDERRVATVLFADLAGFTGLSESLDPEQVKNLVDRCFSRLALDVTSHGGVVDKVLGDAIVAIFGAPVAHEDDPERAVRAALQMQRTIAALSAETRDAGGVSPPLEMRVGVNTGEVLVGSISAGGDYTAMGDAVNVAARLQTMAERGTVVVGPSTYAATSAVVRYEPLGPLRARGREAAVEGWRAVETLAPPGDRSRGMGAPLVGRDTELCLLRESLSLALGRGRPQVTLLLGEAGIGKSRLAAEAARWAASERGALVLEGRCLPYGEANPWWPVAEAVRAACDVAAGDSAVDAEAKIRSTVAGVCSSGVDEVTAGLRHLMGDEEALADVDPQRARLAARRSLQALLSGLARRSPVLLVLSDLHWADDLVLDVLGWYLERLTGLPVAVLATARPEIAERWVPRLGHHNLLTMHLDPLDAESSTQLAVALSEGGLPEPTMEALVARSGGNPFYLEELLRFVGESPPAPGDLPVSLRGLVAARLDSLPAEERSVLEDAAVIGRSGALDALEALSSSRGVTSVGERATRLFQEGLLLGGDGRFEFRSEVVRDVAYEILTKAERARRHWTLASWMSEMAGRAGRTDEVLESIAHHHATAAELVGEMGPVAGVPPDAAGRAAAALEKAARWASRREMPLAAVRLLERGVRLAPAGSARCTLLVARAMARATLHDLAGARADVDEVFGGSDSRSRAGAITVLGYVEQLEGNLETSKATLSAALAAWRELGDREGEGEALRRYGMTCMLSGEPQAADGAFSEALAIAREVGSHRDEAWAMWHLAQLSFYANRTDDAERRLAEAEAAFAAAGDSGGIGWVRGLLGYVRMVQGRRTEAEELALSILDEVRDLGDRWALGMTLVLLALVRIWEGRAGLAVDTAAEAAAVFESIGDRGGQMRAAAALARALAATGRAEEARAAARREEEAGGASKLDQPSLARVTIAAHLGDWQEILGAELGGPDLAAAEEEVTVAFAELLAGRPADAAGRLAGADGAYGCSVAALARACAGDPEAALESASRALARGPEATYRDRAMAYLAEAFARHCLGDAAGARRAADEAGAAVEATDDVVTAAAVGLAAARLFGDGPAAAEARERLRAMGAPIDGWERLAEMGAGARR